MKTFKSVDDVIKKLKAVAKRESNKNYKAYLTLRYNNRDVSYVKDMNYRTDFGPFKVRAGVFRNSSGSYYFDPINLKAVSYGWWEMLVIIKGQLVRNECGYSMQTAVQQRSLDITLKALGIKPDITVNTRSAIGDVYNWRQNSLSDIADMHIRLKYCQKKSKKHYLSRIKYLTAEFNKLVIAGIFKKIGKSEFKKMLNNADVSRVTILQRKRDQKIREQEHQRDLIIKTHGLCLVS